MTTKPLPSPSHPVTLSSCPCRPTARRVLSALSLTAALLFTSACAARKDYPEAGLGWHSTSFNAIYGQLQRSPGPTPESPPVWTIRFGESNDPFQGQLALTPPERLTGYSGGERVEIKGYPFNQATTDPYNGRWYVVDSIQMWSGYK